MGCTPFPTCSPTPWCWWRYAWAPRSRTPTTPTATAASRPWPPILIGAGLGIAINAATRLSAGEVPRPTWPALVAALFSIGANEWLFQIQVRIGRRYQASSVVANAWHHRTDALSSMDARTEFLRFLNELQGTAAAAA